MTNEEVREQIHRLLQADDEVLVKLFGTYNLNSIYNDYHVDEIKELFDNFDKPKYGNVYANKSNSKDKCVFLGEDCNGKYWLLCDDIYVPQRFSKSSFEKNYAKTGKNVADELKRFFE